MRPNYRRSKSCVNCRHYFPKGILLPYGTCTKDEDKRDVDELHLCDEHEGG